MKRYWLSFRVRSSMAEFEYHGPWWISGIGGAEMDEPNVCLAVVAADEEGAKRVVLDSFDKPPNIAEWRFCEECEPNWEPFNERFARKDWMRWPWPEASS